MFTGTPQKKKSDVCQLFLLPARTNKTIPTKHPTIVIGGVSQALQTGKIDLSAQTSRLVPKWETQLVTAATQEWPSHDMTEITAVVVFKRCASRAASGPSLLDNDANKSDGATIHTILVGWCDASAV